MTNLRFYVSALIFFFLSFPAGAQIPLNPSPTRAVGQTNLTQFAPNLIEGREFNSPQGIALDTTLTPPALYVSDTFNNRVLGFRNAASFSNGQKADIVIGQADFLTSTAQGPRGGTTRATGLALPFGLAVDPKGNLYVVDGGNNRVLRFPQPFSQSNQIPDLVIGQTSFNTITGNSGGISASTLLFGTSSGVSQAYLNFDPSGNLWVADAGNNRVLRYSAASLATGTNGPAADTVLGQTDFASNGVVSTDPTSLNALNSPTGIAVDQSGRLFVSESPASSSGTSTRSRILIYNAPITSAKAASRIIGVVPASVQPQPPSVSEQQLNASSGALFLMNNGVGVADTLNNRLLVYKPADQFTSNTLTQQATLVIGQPDFSSRNPNQGQPAPGPNTLLGPVAAVSSGTEIFIADSANNRVLVMPYSNNAVGAASRVLGQDQMTLNTVNLIEGREFRFVSGTGANDAGIVIDSVSDTPHLYVSDTYNNRVLGFKDARLVKFGDKADIVIGQPDFVHSQVNYPNNDANKPTASSLFAPIGLAIDNAGNLYVADAGNGRVLRFPRPFANPQSLPTADLVLGQRSFTSSRAPVATSVTMSIPYGLAFAGDNGLLVSDEGLNRVLLFGGHAASFTSGMAALNVFGQPDFTSSGASSSSSPEDNRMNLPHHIATDTDDRLYVTDTGNSRVMIFDRAPTQGSDPRAGTIITGLANPQGIYVSPSTGEIWVAATQGSALLRFPAFNNLGINNNASNFTIGDGGPLAVVQDAFGSLYTADGLNRVQINFPSLDIRNGANFIQSRALAPGAISTIFGTGNQFGTNTQAAGAPPLTTQLANIQVLFNGTPAPLYYVGPSQINWIVPMSAPTSGTADVLVQRADTGQILGNYPVAMAVASPALFTSDGSGQGQVAAINQDGSINGKDHPAPNRTYVSFYGTGQGFIPNAPPDGTAAGGPISTPQRPLVVIGTIQVPDQNVQYSGLAPGLPGVWQVNVLIPNEVAPTTSTVTTPVAMVLNSVFTNGSAPNRLVTTMWVKAP